MKTITAVTAFGATDPGQKRPVNEDRFHCDMARGLFIVVDGIGGQAAGGKAADLAIGMLRARLERETGTVADRVREAITVANNEIRRTASLRPEWHGMACVLTAVVVDEGRAVVGHVGDTRLYKIRHSRITKMTRDHSPVGEREDAREISETDAMRHPRRNEVYRDVGSEPHQASDPDFIDLDEILFEPDAALLLCSDGLTDLVDSTTILEVAMHSAGRPHDVVSELIQAANDAGGTDNITAVYVEGDQFAPGGGQSDEWTGGEVRAAGARNTPGTESRRARLQTSTVTRGRGSRRVVRAGLLALIALAVGLWFFREDLYRVVAPLRAIATGRKAGGPIVVTSPGSISAAMANAAPGTTVVVEPGEYRERLVFADGVRLVSRVPRGATIRLPGSAAADDPAVVAEGVTGAEMTGFRIVGDAATPLGTGIFAREAEISVVDVEITGASHAAIALGDAARLTLLASNVHDNPGAALTVGSGANSRISQNVFARNGLSERVGAVLIVEPGSQPAFFGNVFHGIAPDAFRALGDVAAAAVARDNWFMDAHEPAARPSNAGRGRGR